MSVSKEKIIWDKAFNRLVVFLLIVITIIAIFISYFLKRKEDENRHSYLEEKLKKLNQEFTTKQELKNRLDTNIDIYFRYTRILLVMVYFAFNTFIWLYLADGVNWRSRLSLVMDINQASFIIILVILFVRFDNTREFRDIFRMIHLKIKDLVYKNHPQLEKDLLNINKEIQIVTEELKEIKHRLSFPDKSQEGNKQIN